MSLKEIRENRQTLVNDGVEPDIVATCYHNHMVNELSKRLTKSKLGKLSESQLEILLETLDELTGEG